MKTLTIKKNFRHFADDIDKHEIFTLAGSLAYTTALAIAPFLLILLSVASLLGPEMQEKLYTNLASAIGEKAGQAIIDIVQNTKKNSEFSGISGLIGFIILIVSASAIFAQMRVALDKINEHKVEKDKSGLWLFIKDRFLSMGLVVGFAFLSIVSMMVSTTIALVFTGGEGLFWEAISLFVNFAIFSVLFMAIFRVIPSDKLEWRRCRISGMVSAVFYLIGKNLISLYLAHAGLESSYGAAGSLVAFLAWVYYTTMTLLISYEFTKNMVLYKKEEKVPPGVHA